MQFFSEHKRNIKLDFYTIFTIYKVLKVKCEKIKLTRIWRRITLWKERDFLKRPPKITQKV